jgi:hypothetical protein
MTTTKDLNDPFLGIAKVFHVLYYQNKLVSKAYPVWTNVFFNI